MASDDAIGGAPVAPNSALTWAMVVIAAILLVTALAMARVLIVPIILAFLLALVFSPFCRALRRRGVPDAATAGLVVTGLLAVALAGLLTLAVPVTTWIDDAPSIAREIEWKLRDLTGVAEAVARASEEVQKAADAVPDGEAEPVKVVIDEGGPLSTVALGAPLIVAQGVFVLVLMFFILASGNMFYARLVRVMPTFTDKRRAIQIAYDVEREVSRYLLSITAINAGLGVAVGTALAFLGMPNPLVFGFLAFALNFVPFLGAVIGTVLAFSVALVSLPTAFDAMIVAAVYLGLTSLEGQIITPWLVGRRLQLNTVVILIAVAFWAWLWSVMGMIMAVPLLVAFRIVCRHVPALSPVEEFLAGPDPPKETA